MGFWKNLFKTRKIIKTEIVSHEEGLSEDEEFDNLVIGDMEEGFEGMLAADIFNQENSSKTTFKIFYDDGTCVLETVNDDSRRFEYLSQFLK